MMVQTKPVTTSNEGRVIQLDARKKDGFVVVTPQDENRFMLKVDEAITACQMHEQIVVARQRFRLLLNRLAAWAVGRDDLKDCFLTDRDGALCFVAVRREPTYDRDFESALSALDIELATDKDIRFNVDVLSLPPLSEAAQNSFVGSEIIFRLPLAVTVGIGS